MDMDDNGSSVKTKRRIISSKLLLTYMLLPALVVVLLSAAALLTSCAGHKHNEEEHSEAEKHSDEQHADEIVLSKHQAEEADIQTEEVSRKPFRASLCVGGQVLSAQGDEQTVAATSAGIVSFASTSMIEGAAVGRGQTVAYISASGLQDGEPMKKIRAAYVAAKEEYERAQSLIADKIVSQKEFAQIKMQYETARAAYEAQAAHFSAKGVAVSAPMGGYVKTRMVAQGDYVSVGQPIAVITQNRRLYLRADVPVADADMMRRVSGACFKMEGADTLYVLDQLHGQLLSYGRSVDAGGAYIPITFEFDNVGQIVSGAFAQVWLLADERQGVISVPVEALTEEQGTTFVYLQVHPDAYKKREVTIGGCDGRRVEIVKGLKEGEKVVTKGAYQVRLAASSAVIPAHNHNH